MCLISTIAVLIASAAALAAKPSFIIDATHSAGTVRPTLYELMTEGINHSYDGGLYAELIQNRTFMNDAKSPALWSVVKDGASAATITLDPANP